MSSSRRGLASPLWVLVVAVLLPGCFLDRAGLSLDSGAPIPVDAGRVDGGSAMDGGNRIDAGSRTDAGSRIDAGDATDAGAADAGTDAGIDPGTDAGIDAGPRSCADLFSGTRGYIEVCPGSTVGLRCVLVVVVDPDRRTCDGVCAEAGWSCAGAAGAASTTPRCAAAPDGMCDQDLRIQVCACEP